MLFRQFVVRCVISALLLAFAGGVSAIGLGDLQGQPILGQALSLEISLLGNEKNLPKAQCFSLIQPAGTSDLPWLKKGNFVVKRLPSPVLEITTYTSLREPILQLAVYVGCGHEVVREYTLIASPAGRGSEESASPSQSDALVWPTKLPDKQKLPVESLPKVQRPASGATAAKRPAEIAPAVASAPQPYRRWDNLAGEPVLRLTTSLAFSETNGQTSESQRELLRLEYRLLIAMQEQANTQLSAAEKLRSMEEVLGQLKHQAADFAQRVEDSRPLASATEIARQEIVPAQKPIAQHKVQPTESLDDGWGSWYFLASLLGGLVGLAGWLGWRRYQAGRGFGADIAVTHSEIGEFPVDPQRLGECDELGGVDLAVEPATMGMPLEANPAESAETDHSTPALPNAGDSGMSIASFTPAEHPEANPVMELADIMLSFGRVKGAAQALQEFVDHNPQEALKPWIRLMEVYRIAGMRNEFEEVAHNLNRTFNVEVQKWDEADDRNGVTESGLELVLEPMARPQSVEDMPRIIGKVIEMWNTADVVGFLFELLRDNRGGQRIGFALPVVEDILFLIELKETANRME